jgi:simple sugar transport system ATP-binding protein
MSVRDNLALRTFDVADDAKVLFWLDNQSQGRKAEADVADYRIKTPSVATKIGELSGGNVQRAVLARELREEAACLVAANPCFGLDFAAVSEIRSRLIQARNSGTAVLLISADLDEIFALSDRIVVISEGSIVYETAAESADIAVLGRYMAGHHDDGADESATMEKSA